MTAKRREWPFPKAFMNFDCARLTQNHTPRLRALLTLSGNETSRAPYTSVNVPTSASLRSDYGRLAEGTAFNKLMPWSYLETNYVFIHWQRTSKTPTNNRPGLARARPTSWDLGGPRTIGHLGEWEASSLTLATLMPLSWSAPC